MRSHRFARAAIAMGSLGLAFAGWSAGCAQGHDPDFEGEGAGTTTGTTPVGGGGSGGQIVGGGGAGGESPCGVDCSTIETDQCHEGVCDEDTLNCAVVAKADDTPCDDEQFCTIGDACDDGTCMGGGANDCGQTPDACSEIICNEGSQSCSSQPLTDGSPCVPSDLCQVNATCTNGLCTGSPKDCLFAPVPNECHVSQCNSNTGDCEPVAGNDGDTCHDENDMCLVNGICSGGNCNNTVPVDCSALTQGCFNGICDSQTGLCEQDPVPPGGDCAEATDDCNQGICDANGDCNPNPINGGQACDDGFPCTSGTLCTAGQCTGGSSGVTLFMAEDFQGNAAGWTLDGEWQIGSALASSGHSISCGSGDPASDHTPTIDNGIAGATIGGNVSTALHPFYYLTSPAVDTTGSPTVTLQYWRWLNSDYASYMQNQVEVFNGSIWVALWQSGPSPGIQDSTWSLQTHDISAYSNPALQVRFSWEVGSSGAYTCSGWNLDDVVIASAGCF